MTKKEYNQMLDLAIKNMEGKKHANLIARLMTLKFDCRTPNNTYVKKEDVVKAKERIECYETLIALDLIKED